MRWSEQYVQTSTHPRANTDRRCLQLFGDVSGAASAKHTLNSVIPELEGAAGVLHAELAYLKEEEATLLDSVQQTIGALSDLRYGKFANGRIGEGVIDGLKNVEAACENKS